MVAKVSSTCRLGGWVVDGILGTCTPLSPCSAPWSVGECTGYFLPRKSHRKAREMDSKGCVTFLLVSLIVLVKLYARLQELAQFQVCTVVTQAGQGGISSGHSTVDGGGKALESRFCGGSGEHY